MTKDERLKVLEKIRECDAAIVRDKNNATEHCCRGIAYYSLRAYESAIKDFTTAIELNPKYAIAYAYRARVHYKLGRVVSAILDYERVCEINLL